MRKINFRNWKKIVLVLFVLGVAFFALSGYLNKVFDRVMAPVIGLQSTVMERLNFVINLFTISQSEVELAAENEELKKQVSELQNYII